MVSEEGGHRADIISKVAQAALQAGQGVIQGTADEQAQLPAASGDITGLPFLGVAVYDPSKMTNWPSGNTTAYPAGQAVGILRKGRVWVYTEEAVTPADAPYCRYASGGGGSVLGRFRKSADSSSAAALPSGKARFMTTAGAGSLVLLELS
jgi:hypothetical protein